MVQPEDSSALPTSARQGGSLCLGLAKPSPEEPDAGNRLVRDCGGLGRKAQPYPEAARGPLFLP